MPDDALAKAVEAIREWLRNCGRRCPHGPVGVDRCSGRQCLDYHAQDITRAVLEAAGYDEMAALIRELVSPLVTRCAICSERNRRFPECKKTCNDFAIITRAQAALARAGKEA